MQNNNYLYGTDIVPNIPEEVANERIRLLYNNLNNLVKITYEERDDIRVHHIMEAIKFWKKLRDGKE